MTSSVNGTNSATTIQVPYVITETAMLRVRDSDADFKDLVYKNSASFKIYGDISFLAPLSSTNWPVQTTQTVSWNDFGDSAIGNMNIYADYGSGYGASIATVDVTSLNSWQWGNIPDQVSNTVRLKFIDTEYIGHADEAINSFITDQFSLIGDK